MELTVIEPDETLRDEMINTRAEDPVPIDDGISVTWEVPMFKAAGIPQMIDVTIWVAETIPTSVASTLISAWIINRFKGRAERIIIARQAIELEDGNVRRIVSETITRERGG